MMNYRYLLALLLTNTLGALAQSTVSTMPATLPNNGSSAVTFEITANQAIFLTGLSNVFSAAAGTSGTVEVWYRLGGALAAGQTVRLRTLESVNGVQRHSIDMSSCASGLYLLQITSEEGVVTRRIAIQK